MAKRSSDQRVAYPEVKIQVRDLVLVVGLPPLPHEGGGGQYSGRIRFIEPHGVNEHRRIVSGTPSSGTQGKVQGRDCVGFVEGSCGTGPAGSVFGENSLYRETRGTRLGGSPCGLT